MTVNGLYTKEYYDLIDAFERTYRHLRLDRENKAAWATGHTYQNDTVNELFKAYRSGYSLAQAMHNMEAA